MTTQLLKENAAKLGAEIYEETICEWKQQIGVRFKSPRYFGLIHWFEVYTFSSGEISISFSHSYSQNTGETKKGVRHGLNIERKLGFYA